MTAIPSPSLWIERGAMRSMEREAEISFPLETGGILIGYFAKSVPVIFLAIGPGPKAIHSEGQFAPDYDYHIAETALAYRQSGQVLSYLGDWHTHPDQESVFLSSKDIETLRGISLSKEARVRTPIMMVLSGRSRSWSPACWQLRRSVFGAYPRLIPEHKWKIFDASCWGGDFKDH